jgi:SAM-dependent methyltransferase
MPSIIVQFSRRIIGLAVAVGDVNGVVESGEICVRVVVTSMGSRADLVLHFQSLNPHVRQYGPVPRKHMPEAEHERRFYGEAERLRSPERIGRLEVDRVVALATEGLAATSVLDIGTGTGVFAEAFSAKGLAVVGIDVNRSLLELARQLVPGVEFREGTAEAIPCGDRTFDVAFLGHLLHEADDRVAALREARRVSAKRVVVLEWPYEPGEHGPPLEHRLKPEEVKEMARQAGLASVEHLRLTYMDLYRMAVGREGG